MLRRTPQLRGVPSSPDLLQRGQALHAALHSFVPCDRVFKL